MSTATQLVSVGQWTTTALALPDQMTFDEWLGVGEKLHAAERSLMWWVGDWLMYGEAAFSEKLAKASDLTGYTADRLKEARRVAAAFPPAQRSPNVGWEVHRLASSLNQAQRVEVIQHAEQTGMTTREVRAMVARMNVDNGRDEGRQPLALPSVTDGLVKRTSKIVQAAFGDWFGVGEEYSRVILCLYQASGKPIDWRDIARFVSAHSPMSRGAVHEAIHVLREAFDSEAIDRDDNGYWLTDVGLAECRRALRELGQQLSSLGAEAANDGAAAH